MEMIEKLGTAVWDSGPGIFWHFGCSIVRSSVKGLPFDPNKIQCLEPPAAAPEGPGATTLLPTTLLYLTIYSNVYASPAMLCFLGKVLHNG